MSIDWNEVANDLHDEIVEDAIAQNKLTASVNEQADLARSLTLMGDHSGANMAWQKAMDEIWGENK